MKKLIPLLVVLMTWNASESHPVNCCKTDDYKVDPQDENRGPDLCDKWTLSCWSEPVVTKESKEFDTQEAAQQYMDDMIKGNHPEGTRLGSFEIISQ